MPDAWYEFELCSLLHCTPSQLEREDAVTLGMFWEIIGAKRHEEWLEGQRAKQGRKA